MRLLSETKCQIMQPIDAKNRYITRKVVTADLSEGVAFEHLYVEVTSRATRGIYMTTKWPEMIISATRTRKAAGLLLASMVKPFSAVRGSRFEV